MVLAVLAGGCSRLGYYAHLGRGGLSLLAKGRSVERLIADSDTDAALRERLQLAESVRAYAEAELGLPAGGKYRKYADLGRPYAVWTVVAAPEFSLEAKTWCFPVAGCVGYRGFFSPSRAERFAAGLSDQRFDVSVGGVRAFSTLGWFGDPLLNTFVFLGDRDLAGLLFHELAHSLVYVSDDTAFNESFATVVEREGVRRWLARGDDVGQVAEYTVALEKGDGVYAAVEATRARLEELYESDAPDKSETKAEIFGQLRHRLEALDPKRRTAFAGWVDRDLNNADLASVGLYREWLDPLEALLAAVEGDLDGFYAGCRCLAALDADERSERLRTNAWSDCILGAFRQP